MLWTHLLQVMAALVWASYIAVSCMAASYIVVSCMAASLPRVLHCAHLGSSVLTTRLADSAS